jgi:hypothetical protein
VAAGIQHEPGPPDDAISGRGGNPLVALDRDYLVSAGQEFAPFTVHLDEAESPCPLKAR